MKTTSFKILLFLALMLSFSCDPGKRMLKICARHPEVCKRDTIEKKVTVQFKTPGFKADSVYTADLCDTLIEHDTVYLTKGNVIAKHHYNPKTKRSYFSIEAKPQTFNFEHTIKIVNTDVKFKKDWLDYFGFIITFVGGALFMWPFIAAMFRKLKRNE